MFSATKILCVFQSITIGCLFSQILLSVTATKQVKTLSDKCSIKDNGIMCYNLQDGDLPFPDGTFPAGIYDHFGIYSSPNITVLPENTFGQGVIGREFSLLHSGVLTYEPNFLGAEDLVQHIESIEIQNIPAETFPWNYLKSFTSLKTFRYYDSGLISLAANIPWSSTITEIFFRRNYHISSIESNAFESATGLQQLDMWSMGSNVTINENAFRISARGGPILRYYGERSSYWNRCSVNNIAPNAFGNVEGGPLWGKMSLDWCDFPELAFRLMLKTAFDKGQQALIDPMQWGAPSQIFIPECDCSISWLYKDAHRFGLTQYKNLVGDNGNNIICDSVGPILLRNDPEFIAFMDSCPETPMPWGENYCKDHSSSENISDTTRDPNDCHCYYHCTDKDTIAGHECCPPGLVFNPVIKTCDWPQNVPKCEA